MNPEGPWPHWLPKSPKSHILNGVVCWVECCSINSWTGWSASICCCVVRTVTWLLMWSKMAGVYLDGMPSRMCWTENRHVPDWLPKASLSVTNCSLYQILFTLVFQHRPLARYLKLQVAHAPEIQGMFPWLRVSDLDFTYLVRCVWRIEFLIIRNMQRIQWEEGLSSYFAPK